MIPVKIRGFARDFSVDQLPSGYVWNMIDYIPDKHGAKLEGRGAWTYLSDTAFAGTIWGGYHAPFRYGPKLIACNGAYLYDQPGWENPNITSQGSPVYVGPMFDSVKHNGVMLRDRVYFADGAGLAFPKYVTYDGTLHIAQLGGTAVPKPVVIAAYKDRLLAGGNPADPAALYFSPIEGSIANPNGPLGPWDARSYIRTSRGITGIMPMSGSVLVFHDGMITKVRGAIPPETNVDTDMSTDVFSAQLGCTDPASIVPWQENVIFANPRGIHLTDGSTIRSLTDQGGIGEVWRELYALKRSGTQVCAEVYLDELYVSILTSYTGATPTEQRSFMFVCDLSQRTWYRFENVEATAMIRSNTGGEQVWWGVDSQNRAAGLANRLARLSPLVSAQREADPDAPVAPYADVVDGDGVAVLPRMETGWQKLSRNEIEKRIRNVYVSHVTQSQSQPNTDALKIGAKVSPAPYSAFTDLGNIPAAVRYTRRRVRLGRPVYGLQVKVEQVIPTHVSCLYDIGVEAWTHDGTKL